jgi:4-amino-4-deoxy-L-arabinose transferase-like glycosyltransferase
MAILGHYTKPERLAIFVNLVSALFSFSMAISQTFPDAKGYWLMSEGLMEGRFSSWYFLDTYYPETLRTPGYPLFLLLMRGVCDSVLFVQIVQLLLYFLTLYFSLEVVKKISGNSTLASVVFLALTAFNLQVPYYSGYISADALSVFLTACYIYFFLCKKPVLSSSITLGIVAGINFLMRPSFILFPFIITIAYLFFDRKRTKPLLVHLAVFIVCLMPFSYWNSLHHGKFRPTPVEGGAGVAHIGFWSFKLPRGYQEHYYWGNRIGDDWMDPFSYSAEETAKSKREFEREWEGILAELAPKRSLTDVKTEQWMKDHNPGIFVLHNSEYTRQREKLLWTKTIEHIKEDPWFYLKTRCYSFCRFYFTGIGKAELASAMTWSGKIKTVFPFLITFTCVFLGVVVSLIYLMMKNLLFREGILVLVVLVVYQGLVHVPFAIQARYTVPVHHQVLTLVSFVMYDLWRRYKDK